MPQQGNPGMGWLTKYSASEGVRFFWTETRRLFPLAPLDLDLAAEETLKQLGPEFLRQTKKDDSEDVYFFWARLAVGFWDRLVAHRLTPAVATRVNRTTLASIPETAPHLLQRPWLVEVIEPLKGERLFGDTTALGGYCDPKTGNWNVVGWRIVHGMTQIRVMVTDQPWTAVGKPDLDAVDDEYQWRPDGWHATQPINQEDFHERREWLQAAVQFAMRLGALLEAENTFLRTRDETPKKERSVTSKAASARLPGWITRYVGIDPEDGKRIDIKSSTSPLKAETPLHTDGLAWVEVRVREHVRLQRCGEGNRERRWVRIKAHTSHRWATPNPKRIVIGSE